MLCCRYERCPQTSVLSDLESCRMNAVGPAWVVERPHPECSSQPALLFPREFMNAISSALQNIENTVFCRPSIAPYKPLARRFVTTTPSYRRPPHTCLSPLSYSGPSSHTAIPTRILNNYPSYSARSLRTLASMALTPAEILQQLPAKFEQARESGDLLFFPSTTHKHEAHGVEVCELRMPLPRELLLTVLCSLRSASAPHCRPSPRCRRLVSTRTQTSGDSLSSKKGNCTTRFPLRMSRTC